MKKKIIIYLACLAGLVLVSSCGTRNTIIKRHYMKGYYVDKHDRLHSPATAHTPTHLRTEKEAVGNLPISLEPERSNETAAAQQNSDEITPITAAKKSQARSSQGTMDQKISKPSVRLNERMHLKKPVSSDSDGLSLFWVVILVILILWAIGFLAGGFGIGNLINLLLVVALVLLILWLLRII